MTWLNVIDHPKNVGQIPDGELHDPKDPKQEEGKDWTIPLLLRNRNFWVLAGVFALQFSAMMAVLSHITLFASEKGWASQAALILACMQFLPC